MWVLFGSNFMFSNFYQLYLHNKTCIALANLQWNIYKNWIENWTNLDVVMVSGSACSLISELDTYVLPMMFIIECRVVIMIWRCSPMSFKHVFFMMFALRSPPNHIPLKYRGLIKKTSHLRPIYLKWWWWSYIHSLYLYPRHLCEPKSI